MSPLNGVINIDGHLRALGNSSRPVTFTSTVNSGPGEWNSLIVDNSGKVILDSTLIRYGTNNLSLLSPTSTVTISQSQILSASLNGLTIQDGSLTVSCSTLGDNGVNGLWVDNSGSPSISINQSEIRSNDSAGIANTNTLPVNAIHNWWGAADGPSGAGPGSGDPVFGDVHYEPRLETVPDCPLSQSMIFLPLIVKP